MKRPENWVPILVMLGLAVGGCASPGIRQRQAERSVAYRGLDPGTRSLVDKGRIQYGIDTNAVSIAWGPATDAFSIDIPGGGRRLIWNYEEKWVYEQKRVVPGGSMSAPTTYPSPQYSVERLRTPITYVKKSVTFDGGKVIQWKTYDPPVLDEPLKAPPYSPRLP